MQRPLERRGYYPHTSISSRTFLSASWRQPFSPDTLVWKKDRVQIKGVIFYPPPLPLLQAPSQRKPWVIMGVFALGYLLYTHASWRFSFPAWCCILVFQPHSIYLFVTLTILFLFIYLWDLFILLNVDHFWSVYWFVTVLLFIFQYLDKRHVGS